MPSNSSVEFDALLFGSDGEIESPSVEPEDVVGWYDEPAPDGPPRKFGSTEDFSPNDTVTMDESSCVFPDSEPESTGPSSHEVSRIDYPTLAPVPEESTPDQESFGSGSLLAPRVGERFGRYVIRRALGNGMMGAVFLAEDTVLEREVALKLPNIEDDDPEMLERFHTEARIAATLRHPNICPVYDVGDVDGRQYISMAFIPGRPLSNYARSKYRHPIRQVVKVVRKLAFALHAAHVVGIVHRDVKPANVMIDDSREPILMDFGLARKADPEGVRLTRAGAVLGTPAYMSPEQVEGRIDEVGPPSDQFSLGAVFYELLTGVLPFEGESLASVMARILRETPEDPRSKRKEIDESLAETCQRMLNKAVEERFDSLADVAEELGEWLRVDKARSLEEAGGGLEIDGREPSPRGSSRIKIEVPARKEPKSETPAPARTKVVPRRDLPGGNKSPRRRRRPGERESSVWPWVAIGFAVLSLVFAVRLFLAPPTTSESGSSGALRIEVHDPGVTVEIDGRKIHVSDARSRDEESGRPKTIRVDDAGTGPTIRSTFKPAPGDEKPTDKPEKKGGS